MLRKLWSKLRAAWPVNRVVSAITPFVTLISGAASGWVVSWAAANMPGLPVMDSNWLAGIFTAGALAGSTAVISAARKWMDGHIKYEELLANPQTQPLVKLPTSTELGVVADATLMTQPQPAPPTPPPPGPPEPPVPPADRPVE